MTVSVQLPEETDQATTTRLIQEAEGPRDIRDRASRTAPGWDAEAMPAQEVLNDLLRLAISHDTVCQWHEHHAYRYYGVAGFVPLDARSHDFVDDAPMGDYRAACVDLCARLASAALKRIPELTIWQKAAADWSDELYSLTGEELRDFLFPIFEESGIPGRFEVRAGYEVYPGGRTA